jgi:hypothetical protein
MRRDKEENPELSVEAIAKSAHRACCHALGVEPAEWEAMDESECRAWRQVALHAKGLSERGVTDKPERMAEAIYDVFAEAANVQLPFGQLDEEWRLTWEAVARHLAFLVSDAEPDDPLDAQERQWRAWAEQRRTPSAPGPQ